MGLLLTGGCVPGACGRIGCVHSQTLYLKNVYDSEKVSPVFLLVILRPGGMPTVIILPHAEEWLLFSILVFYVLRVESCVKVGLAPQIVGLYDVTVR